MEPTENTDTVAPAVEKPPRKKRVMTEKQKEINRQNMEKGRLKRLEMIKQRKLAEELKDLTIEEESSEEDEDEIIITSRAALMGNRVSEKKVKKVNQFQERLDKIEGMISNLVSSKPIPIPQPLSCEPKNNVDTMKKKMLLNL